MKRRISSGSSRCLLEQDLDGEVAADVAVAALEDGAHAAAGDLAEELEPRGGVGGRGHLGRAGFDDGSGLGRRVGVAEQDAGDGPDGSREAGQDGRATRAGGQRDRGRRCRRRGRG